MNRIPLVVGSAGTALALLASSAVLVAGPLSPPAGPVSGSYKTLSEVEPRIAINAVNTPGDANSLYRISQPGSYYLAGNLAGVAGKRGIEIATSDVTIDLGGFRMAAGAGSLDAIGGDGPIANIAIRNGTIQGWAQHGIYLSSIHSVTIENIRANNNTGSGIIVGNTAVLTDCISANNSSDGFSVGASSTIRGCTAQSNGGDGYFLGTGSTMTDSTAKSNGERGFVNNGKCVFTGVTSTMNTDDGGWATSSIFSKCTFAGNGGEGLHVFHSVVEHCTFSDNALDGIGVEHRSIIQHNLCSNNGLSGEGAGIHIFGNDSRVESNHCLGQDQGIEVVTAGNIIIRNTCSGNTVNWSIVANNYYGPIVDRTGVATAAVNGSVAAGTLATSDSNANFTY